MLTYVNLHPFCSREEKSQGRNSDKSQKGMRVKYTVYEYIHFSNINIDKLSFGITYYYTTY